MLTPKQIKIAKNRGDDWLDMLTWDIYMRYNQGYVRRDSVKFAFDFVAAQDPETAKIILTRYEKEWSWEKVAMMFYLSRRTVLRRVYNFFDEMKTILYVKEVRV